MPFDLYEKVSGLMRDHIFLCRKCGEPVDLVGQVKGNRVTTFQIQCPVHGLGDRPVNTSLVGMTLDTSKPVHTIAETPAVAAAGPVRFCPSCGIQVAAPEAAFCHNCGASLR